MLTFERLAEVLEILGDRLDLDMEDIREIDCVLSPIAAQSEVYITAAEAKIMTWEDALRVAVFGSSEQTEEMAMMFEPEEDDDDDDD